MSDTQLKRVITVLITLIFTALSFSFSKNLLVHYPDEHFQTLEISSLLMNQFGWKSWEWLLGSRSYFVPILYLPLFGILGIAGLRYGPLLLTLLKFGTSLVVFFGVFSGLKRTRDWNRDSLVLMSILLLQPFFIYFSTTTFTDTLTMGLVGALMPIWTSLIEDKRKSERGLFISGVLIGLLFLFRVQNVIFFAGLGFAFFLQKRFRPALYLSLGLSTAILFSGMLDWLTWGTPFKSTIENIYYNVFKGVASSNGVQAYSFYFSEYIQYIGLPATLLWFGAFFYRFARKPLLYLGPFLFLMAHFLVPHKELRFLLPLVPFFFFAILEVFQEIPVTPLKKYLLCSLLLIGVGLGVPKWKSEDFTTQFGIAELSLQSGPLLRMLPDSERTLLLIDSYWVWGRGEMAVGAHVQWKEKNHENVDLAEMSRTSVVILGRSGLTRIEEVLRLSHHRTFEDRFGRSIWLKNI